MNEPWIVVDVETTGIDPTAHRVISVAALVLTRDGHITHRMSTLLNPAVEDPGPTHIHGLTRQALRGAPQFADIIADLAALLNGRTMVAHNADFDHAFLAAEATRCGTQLPLTQTLCTVELATKLNLGLGTLKLASLARHYGVTQTRPHDALDDATVLAEIFRHTLTDATNNAVPLPIRPTTNTTTPAARPHPWPCAATAA